MWVLWAWGLLAACAGFEPLPTADCRARVVYWPDADGDGIGEPGDVYVGCDPPSGWVDVPPATTTTTGTQPTTQTDTGSLDTSAGVIDTAPLDTGDSTTP